MREKKKRLVIAPSGVLSSEKGVQFEARKCESTLFFELLTDLDA